MRAKTEEHKAGMLQAEIDRFSDEDKLWLFRQCNILQDTTLVAMGAIVPTKVPLSHQQRLWAILRGEDDQTLYNYCRVEIAKRLKEAIIRPDNSMAPESVSQLKEIIGAVRQNFFESEAASLDANPHIRAAMTVIFDELPGYFEAALSTSRVTLRRSREADGSARTH